MTSHTWNCTICNNQPHREGDHRCVDCYRIFASGRVWRLQWIAEIMADLNLMDGAGWPPRATDECKSWFLAMWPEYTPCKDALNKIHELLIEIGAARGSVPYQNLCPLTVAQGLAVNAKFEELAG